MVMNGSGDGTSDAGASAGGRVEQRPTSCSSWARGESVDPIGTAGSYVCVVMIEWTGPWPSDVSDLSPLAKVVGVLAGHQVRVLLVKPALPGNVQRVISFRRDNSDWFSGFGRRVDEVALSDVGELAMALGRAELPFDFDTGEVDLLICTHGARDACCGSAGTRLVLDISARRPLALGRAHMNIWRTSHLGGHRFAPTAIVMPEGTAWAYLQPEMIRGIFHRDIDHHDLLRSYRGCLGIAPRAAQAVERVGFRETGWEWLSHPRRVVEHGNGWFTVESAGSGGERFAWKGLVVDGRKLPVPVCRMPIECAEKTESELVVATYQRQE